MHRRHVLAAAFAAVTAVAAPALLAPTALAERFVAVDANNRLYVFDDQRPGSWERSRPLTGLAAGERVVGIDVRPANRQLVALTNRSRLYNVSRPRARATPIGSGPFTPALAGSTFGFDFNPTVDRIRLVSNSGQNLRLHPDTGAVAETDGTLAFKEGDPSAGTGTAVLAAAYTNNVAGATTTTLYTIDAGKDALLIQDPPNDGVLSTVGPLGVNLTGPMSFDISARDGKAFVLARRAGAPRSRLFSIDLATGAARQLGAVSRAPNLVAFAALSPPGR
ncbi:MAG: DUF4394 domain-containing protein [Solirubrobacteraceae bacterium]|nr:DUF4394 domain-containing protein [Solirubrobacteraceae bacterium]